MSTQIPPPGKLPCLIWGWRQVCIVGCEGHATLNQVNQDLSDTQIQLTSSIIQLSSDLAVVQTWNTLTAASQIAIMGSSCNCRATDGNRTEMVVSPEEFWLKQQLHLCKVFAPTFFEMQCPLTLLVVLISSAKRPTSTCDIWWQKFAALQGLSFFDYHLCGARCNRFLVPSIVPSKWEPVVVRSPMLSTSDSFTAHIWIATTGNHVVPWPTRAFLYHVDWPAKCQAATEWANATRSMVRNEATPTPATPRQAQASMDSEFRFVAENIREVGVDKHRVLISLGYVNMI